MSTEVYHPMKMTVAEMLAALEKEGKPVPMFFVELVDQTTRKGYGIREVKVSEVSPTRVIGVYGRETRTFTEMFHVERGPKLVSVRATPAKPVVCWEYLYASV